MAGFRATSDGVTARFAKPEAAIIRDLVEQVVELVEEIGSADAGGSFDLIGLADDAAPESPGPASAPAGPAGTDAASRSDKDQFVPDADQLAAMVGMGEPTDLPEPEMPDDPVLARLLPDGYRDDPAAAKEFRKFTESGLRSAKVAAARTLLATLPRQGGKVRLSLEQAEAWLRSLNDVRLALGVRLGVTEEFDALGIDRAPDDPRFAYILVYQWLAELQDSLVSALS